MNDDRRMREYMRELEDEIKERSMYIARALEVAYYSMARGDENESPARLEAIKQARAELECAGIELSRHIK